MPYFPGLSPIRLDKTNGYVGINTDPTVILDIAANGSLNIDFSRYQASAASPGFRSKKARGTLSIPGNVLVGDSLGFFSFSGYNNGSFRQSIRMRSVVTGVVGDNVESAFTIDSGDGTLLEIFRVNSDGKSSFGNVVSPTALLHLAASTTARAQLRFDDTTPADPTTPNNGDVWFNTRLKLRRGGATELVATGIQAAGGATTATGSWTATEQAMLQAVYDAARTFGLLT